MAVLKKYNDERQRAIDELSKKSEKMLLVEILLEIREMRHAMKLVEIQVESLKNNIKRI